MAHSAKDKIRLIRLTLACVIFLFRRRQDVPLTSAAADAFHEADAFIAAARAEGYTDEDLA